MNKIEILEKLNTLTLDKSKYIIISGASLVLQDVIKETPDIDLTTNSEYYNTIDWKTKTGAFDIDIKYFDCFEISDNLYELENIIELYGYKLANLNYILKIKKSLNREKDQEIIKKLEKMQE